ncbi:hypothetical protein HaLaN_28258 [Haematococcus lacustris]|uniref:Uncharacterized protein n=1 Tax=Haematococcus lacustris TaxID=44745 RepID=A0A6A0AC09_HAELA|nr:hypothetical protein HaLaN_28258 [Haematococcus lacustris]
MEEPLEWPSSGSLGPTPSSWRSSGCPADKSAAVSVGAAAASSAAPQSAAGQACGDVRLVAASGRAGLFTLLRSDPASTKAKQTSTLNKKSKDTETRTMMALQCLVVCTA